MTVHQKVNMFVYICLRRAFSIFYFLFFKIKFWLFSCLVLGFTCLHFLLNVSKMWFANLLTTIFTKNWAILFVHVQRNLHVTYTMCCTLSIICNPLRHVYSNSWVLNVPHCLVKHVGAGLRDMAWKKWHFAWEMIWSRHIDGEKCALWALPSGKSCVQNPLKFSLKIY